MTCTSGARADLREPGEFRFSLPLVVDVDGTLLCTDLLWEGLTRVLFSHPFRLPLLLVTLVRGKAAFKAEVAQIADLDLGRMPMRNEVLDLIRTEQAQDRRVILASAAHGEQVRNLAREVEADAVVASDGVRNLKGHAKLRAVHEYASTFDYVGDGSEDAPLFQAARKGYLVDPSPWTRLRMKAGVGELELLDYDPWRKLTDWVRALRPHQWSKNGLLLLPILAAHLAWTGALVATVLSGIAAFSLVAAAVYLVNDLADVPYDRQHPTKRERPLAAGRLSISTAWVSSFTLLLIAAGLALRLPAAFGGSLLAYVVLNAAYSGGLKQVPVLDLVILAGLYTIRVVAGAALVEIPLTGWFLAFSIFFFLSLAVVKRVVELQAWEEVEGEGSVAGRGYSVTDLPVLQSVGPAAGVMSALVYCLYITGPVRDLYGSPDLLWLGLPLFLYWIVRIWLLVVRGEVDEDPVVFVLRDLPSYLVLAGFLVVIWLAS